MGLATCKWRSPGPSSRWMCHPGMVHPGFRKSLNPGYDPVVDRPPWEEQMFSLQHEPEKPQAKGLLTIAVTLSFGAALASMPVQAQERGPLVLAKSSYFFVGGK